jgi:hypothetical protein
VGATLDPKGRATLSVSLIEDRLRLRTIAKLQAPKDLPSPYTYRDRFGRWNKALRQAELKPQDAFALLDLWPGDCSMPSREFPAR